MRQALKFTFILFWALASHVGAAGNAVVVDLSEKATVVGPQVTLGDVAQVSGDNKALVQKLQRVALGRAALAGGTVKITLGYLRVALRREGYALNDFTFKGTETAEVLTQSRELSGSDLLPQVKAFVLRQLGESAENVDIKISGLDKKIVLPAGEVKANFRPSFSGNYEGTVLLTTELEVNGHLARVLPLRLTVDVYHPVVTTSKKVEKGEKFSEDNVTLVRTPSSKILSGNLRQLSTVLGRTAALSLPAGTALRISEIYDPPMIRHGQVIQAVVQRGNVELTVQARAIEDGKAGDSIRIENTDSHKLLRGKVIDEKTVLVDREKP